MEISVVEVENWLVRFLVYTYIYPDKFQYKNHSWKKPKRRIIMKILLWVFVCNDYEFYPQKNRRIVNCNCLSSRSIVHSPVVQHHLRVWVQIRTLYELGVNFWMGLSELTRGGEFTIRYSQFMPGNKHMHILFIFEVEIIQKCKVFSYQTTSDANGLHC